jgi:8-oxo-dGTP pyrophosphatase MutT (NUDIX family)
MAREERVVGKDRTEQRRAAGVILFRGSVDDPRVLILRNAREGHLGFAKGHLEPGEGELAGALREVKEETGLVPRVDPVFRETLRYTVTTAKRGTYEKEVVYFLGDVAATDEPVLSKEHDFAEWLSPRDAIARLAHASLRTLLERAARFRESRAGSTKAR